MLTFPDPPIDLAAESSEAENRIRCIFQQHLEKMRNQTTKLFIEINQWRERTVADINKHADEQIKLIEHDYIQQRTTLNQSLEEHLETTRAYLAAQNGELFVELHAECQKLQFQMSQLESVKADMSCPRVTTIEEQVQKQKQQQDSAAVLKTNDHPSETIPEQQISVNVSDKSTENIKDDYPNDKCPICCMIFSKNMSPDERQQHASEHYPDD